MLNGYRIGKLSRKGKCSLTAQDLMTLPIEVDADFPGFTAVIDSISNRIVEAARKKFKRNREIAKALRLSDGAVSQRLKIIKLKAAEKKTESHEVRGGGKLCASMKRLSRAVRVRQALGN